MERESHGNQGELGKAFWCPSKRLPGISFRMSACLSACPSVDDGDAVGALLPPKNISCCFCRFRWLRVQMFISFKGIPRPPVWAIWGLSQHGITQTPAKGDIWMQHVSRIRALLISNPENLRVEHQLD